MKTSIIVLKNEIGRSSEGEFFVESVAIGNRIRELREARGLTQEELAAKTGISYKHISVLERGIKEPRLSTLFSIAEVLCVSPGVLIAPKKNACASAEQIFNRIAELPLEKQEKLCRIIDTLIEQM